MRYEDLISNNYVELKNISKFLLGTNSFEDTKLEYIFKMGFGNVEKIYYTYNIEIKNNDTEGHLTEEKSEIIRKCFHDKLENMMGIFNYRVSNTGGNDEYIDEFNKNSLEKAVEFQDFLNNQFLSSTYMTIKLG